MISTSSSEPAGVGILLLHGISGTPFEFRYLETHLVREGFTVSCPVIEGLSMGSDPNGSSRWTDWSARVSKAYQELAARCSKVYVGGLSAGALLALDLASRKDSRLAGLVLLAPTFVADGWSIPSTLKLFNLVQARWLARRFSFSEREPFGIKDPRVRAMALKAFADEGGGAAFRVNGVLLLEHRRLSHHVKRLLPSIDLPALIVHPREDDQSDLRNAFLLQRRLGARTEVKILEDSYHVVTLDRQRQSVAEFVAEFAGRNKVSKVQAPATPTAVMNLERRRA